MRIQYLPAQIADDITTAPSGRVVLYCFAPVYLCQLPKPATVLLNLETIFYILLDDLSVLYYYCFNCMLYLCILFYQIVSRGSLQFYLA